MDIPLDALFEAAAVARERAYAPYSKFLVGAAVLGESGRIHVGCNVENVAYPVGTCAEAGAIAAMIAAGDRTISAVAITGSGETPCLPCGACRQRIMEFAGSDTRVYCSGINTVYYSESDISALLPASFSIS